MEAEIGDQINALTVLKSHHRRVRDNLCFNNMLRLLLTISSSFFFMKEDENLATTLQQLVEQSASRRDEDFHTKHPKYIEFRTETWVNNLTADN
jgi:hypothetical protein